MSTEVNFDDLAQKTVDAADTDLKVALDNLYGNIYALEKWHFIARGEWPNVNPYAATTEGFADNKPMIRAFTDVDRLQRFVTEHKLGDAEGGHMVMSIPTDGVIGYLEPFMTKGLHGIWFNSDSRSLGFFVPLSQIRTIKQHLDSIEWKPEQ